MDPATRSSRPSSARDRRRCCARHTSLAGTLPAEDLLRTALAKVYLSLGRVRDRGALDAYADGDHPFHVSVWRRASRPP